MDSTTMNQPGASFSESQKQYIQGFMTGLIQRGIGPGTDSAEPQAELTETVYGTPLDDLCKEERIKHEHNGLDIWDRIVANAAANRFPEGSDVFRYKFHGLFYVAPNQDAFMVRLRIPACQLSARQLRGLAWAATEFGNGFLDVTTRGNLQIREIPADRAVDLLLTLDELELTAQGSGADNVRNITASPTSGFDPNEVIDPRHLALALHHTILNHRNLYGLPRKFNVAFDNGGDISVVADTNDIAFYPVRVGEGKGVEPGIYFRVQLGGITGHRQFASDTGLLLTPAECVPAAVAMIRVFIENGDRTNRKKARLKYLLDKWGVPRFLEETEAKLDTPFRRLPLDSCEPRRPVVPHGHLGIHSQRTPGLHYVGIVVPVGRMTAEQAAGLADLADHYGSGDIRLTVWQNLIIPDIPHESLDDFCLAVRELGLDTEASSIRGGFVACTGNQGCKYAAADTKGHAQVLADYLHERLSLPHPINIHLTGCPHSCAQHYCGDIGLVAVKVPRDGESVEGYNLVIGGGVDHTQGIAREFLQAIAADALPAVLEQLLGLYLKLRQPHETFVAFARRMDLDDLRNQMEN